MSKADTTLYTKIAQSNIMSDGMLNEISYGDFALMMVAKDRPIETKHSKKHKDTTTLK